MNAANNSFLLMQEEDERQFPVPPEIEDNIAGTLQVLTMMGFAMEMFIPKALEMFILTMGGTVKEIDGTTKDELSKGDPSKDIDEATPGSAGSFPPGEIL
ncbi:MAG TPA: hypothetical protein ENJ95_07350 [Bacteroidetes bacterium]|nr:hypothetical protein [Bacteroidota bacterium]